MDFYEALSSPYTQAVSIPITTNLPNNTKWWKVKNKPWYDVQITRELNDNYIAEIFLNNSLNTFALDDIVFRIIDTTQDRVVYINKLYDEIIAKEELTTLIKQMATEIIEKINDLEYQVMCVDEDTTISKNGRIWTPYFDLKTGEFMELDKLAPIPLKISLNL